MARLNPIQRYDAFLQLRKKLLKLIQQGLLGLSTLAFIIILLEVGFPIKEIFLPYFKLFYILYLIFFFLVIVGQLIFKLMDTDIHEIRVTEILLLGITTAFLVANIFQEEFPPDLFFVRFFGNIISIRFFIVIIFLIEISKTSLQVQNVKVNPPLVFVASFFTLIIIGTSLLLLPEATNRPFGIVDALFTSTSAVCVTGLIVVDTATHFTSFGQLIILCLIQIGGLGIMTFTTFFGFLFTGGSNFGSSLFIREFINEEKLSSIFSTIAKILIFTFLIEISGAFFIWLSIQNVAEIENPVQFSIFHAISAYCNAGFSTLSDGLYEVPIRFNFSLQWVIALVVIIGGIGFPVVFDFYNTFQYFFIQRSRQIISSKIYQHQSRNLNIHTRLVLITTLFLLLVGFIVFYISEYNNSLQGMSLWGQITTSFFGAVTPRTAGFNTVDMSNIMVPTILIYLILMWIGASPGSTGGGLKTSTFAVAVLNAFSIAQGKDRIEIFRREISGQSVRKAFAVILLSFLVIGLSVLLISLFNPEFTILEIAFECFSAFSTVGLTLGITSELSTGSKIVIIAIMFMGRVGTLTILVAFIRNVKTLNYRYPEENVFVN
jgi:trk system potassium uptake protein